MTKQQETIPKSIHSLKVGSLSIEHDPKMYAYDFYGIFSLETNIPYFDGMFHAFRSKDPRGKFRIRFLLDEKLRISTAGKEKVNIMLHYNPSDNSIEFDYPWFRPICAKLIFQNELQTYTFLFNKNYLRLSNIVAEGWELIDVLRSILVVSLLRNGLYMVHAAAVKIGDRGVLIPAFGNTGKTTTAWMLASRGAEFLTDEFAILDSDGNCFGFPCSSLLSPSSLKALGIRLRRRQNLSLALSQFKSRVFSSRFVPGGIKLHPDSFFRISPKVPVSFVAILQNGTDQLDRIDKSQVIARIRAIQDYEFGWRANPYILAQRFFNPGFDMDWLLSEEETFLQRLVARLEDLYLVSSSSGSHFLQIEKLVT